MFTSFTSKGMYCSASHWIDSSSSSCGHARHRDLLDDHRVAGDADRHLLLLDLQLADQLLDRLDDGGGVHQRAVDDRLGRQRLHAEALQRVDHLPRRRVSLSWIIFTDVEPMSRPSASLPFAITAAPSSQRMPVRAEDTSRACVLEHLFRRHLNPSARMIFRLVSSRHSAPRSTRSMVSTETPARRASSAFDSSCSSRRRWTLLRLLARHRALRECTASGEYPREIRPSRNS